MSQTDLKAVEEEEKKSQTQPDVQDNLNIAGDRLDNQLVLDVSPTVTENQQKSLVRVKKLPDNAIPTEDSVKDKAQTVDQPANEPLTQSKPESPILVLKQDEYGEESLPRGPLISDPQQPAHRRGVSQAVNGTNQR